MISRVTTSNPSHFSAVQPVNKEQLKHTTATISCQVSGLTKKLDDVKWTNSYGELIGSDQEGFTIDPGVFSETSQTTTLTVSSTQNYQDTTFMCLVTADEHMETDKTTTVNLKVFSKLYLF